MQRQQTVLWLCMWSLSASLENCPDSAVKVHSDISVFWFLCKSWFHFSAQWYCLWLNPTMFWIIEILNTSTLIYIHCQIHLYSMWTKYQSQPLKSTMFHLCVTAGCTVLLHVFYIHILRQKESLSGFHVDWTETNSSPENLHVRWTLSCLLGLRLLTKQNFFLCIL